jgi:hypothetical protein
VDDKSSMYPLPPVVVGITAERPPMEDGDIDSCWDGTDDDTDEDDNAVGRVSDETSIIIIIIIIIISNNSSSGRDAEIDDDTWSENLRGRRLG